MQAVCAMLILAQWKETAKSFHWNFDELKWEHCCLMDFMQWSEAHPFTIQLFMGLARFGNFHYHFPSTSFSLLLWMHLIKNNLACAWLCSKSGSEMHWAPERDLCGNMKSWWSNGVEVILCISHSISFRYPSLEVLQVLSYILPIAVVTHTNPN